MTDIQSGLNIKHMTDLVRREICGIFETKDLTEEQKEKYIRSEYQITKKLQTIKSINMLEVILWKK